MAMKTKQELKDVFSGLSSIMLVKGGIANFATVTPDFDLPVTVDTLSLSQAEPTLNRTKVHGLQADWAVTSTAGDITFAATVPSVSKELVEYFLGKTTEIAQATINNQQFKGFSAVLNSKKLNVGFALISDDGEKCLLVKRMAVYARPLFENASTTPFAFALSGTIELEDGASSDSSSEDNIAFLTKKSRLTVAPASLSFTSAADNTGKTITATTKESSVSASSTETWCKTSVSGKVVTVKVDENSGAKRTATVSIFTANEFSAVEVTQDGSLI